MNELLELAHRAGPGAELHRLGQVESADGTLPLLALTLGSSSPTAPALGIFGGVHGVERIGTEVVLAYMRSLIECLHWSPALVHQLTQIRVVFMPLVNPVGTLQGSRCNGQHVDLMRNAPLDAEEKVPFLLGGQRVSRWLPWYRGRRDESMQAEARALCEVVERFLLTQPFSIALDCHSGYGRKDFIWFPYAGSRRPFPHLAEVKALQQLFDRSYPNHTYYEMEPQSLHYMNHGDLWDYLHIQSMQQGENIFLPLTLEMGSWSWLRKNPRQLLHFDSLFNPVLPHRHRRILRRHLILIDFLLRAVDGYRNWLPRGEARQQLEQGAIHHWYENEHH